MLLGKFNANAILSPPRSPPHVMISAVFFSKLFLIERILIGTNTGSFPKNSFRPVFQLRHSRIMVTFENKLHLNHMGEPVSTSGYLPDYWLFPPMGLNEIIRYAKKP